jgi:hypothetical protein
MKALLVTRCGCSRLVDMSLNPAEILNVAMTPPHMMPTMAAAMDDALDTTSVAYYVRKFKCVDLQDYFYLKGGERIWVYREMI